MKSFWFKIFFGGEHSILHLLLLSSTLVKWCYIYICSNLKLIFLVVESWWWFRFLDAHSSIVQLFQSCWVLNSEGQTGSWTPSIPSIATLISVNRLVQSPTLLSRHLVREPAWSQRWIERQKILCWQITQEKPLILCTHLH